MTNHCYTPEITIILYVESNWKINLKNKAIILKARDKLFNASNLNNIDTYYSLHWSGRGREEKRSHREIIFFLRL